jgi:hypothetical protein
VTRSGRRPTAGSLLPSWIPRRRRPAAVDVEALAQAAAVPAMARAVDAATPDAGDRPLPLQSSVGSGVHLRSGLRPRGPLNGAATSLTSSRHVGRHARAPTRSCWNRTPRHAAPADWSAPAVVGPSRGGCPCCRHSPGHPRRRGKHPRRKPPGELQALGQGLDRMGGLNLVPLTRRSFAAGCATADARSTT